MAKKIDIGGELHSTATGNIVADAKEIKYRPTGKEEKTQAQVNDELIEAVGSGGGVDARIANAVNAAKAEIKGNATSACDTLGEAEALISGETSARQSAISNVIGDAASDYNTLGKLEDKIQAEATRAEAAEGALDVRVDTLEEAVGTGGSIDSRISDAVATETTRAQQAESSLSIGKADKATTLTGYGITDAYTKTEINDHIDTPNQGYITAVADSNTTTANLKTLIDTAAGSDKEKADFIYRVGCWDGSQYNDTMYSEYAWINTDYVFLSKKSQIDEVFDISAYHANTPYIDLAAALDSNNGGGVPQSLQKGGMSIKFVQSSDNYKYVQFRLMHPLDNASTAAADFANTANWQGVDEVPIPGSKNYVESGGIEKKTGAALIPTLIDEKVLNYKGEIINNIPVGCIYTYTLVKGCKYVVHVSYKSGGSASLGALYRNSVSDGNLVKSLIYTINDDILHEYNYEFICPEDNYILAVSNIKTVVGCYCNVQEVELTEKEVEKLFSALTLKSDSFDFNSFDFEKGFIRTDGIILNYQIDPNWKFSYFIKLEIGSIVNYSLYGVSAVSIVSFYSAPNDDSFVEGIAGDGSLKTGSFTVAQGKEYIRVCCHQSTEIDNARFSCDKPVILEYYSTIKYLNKGISNSEEKENVTNAKISKINYLLGYENSTPQYILLDGYYRISGSDISVNTSIPAKRTSAIKVTKGSQITLKISDGSGITSIMGALVLVDENANPIKLLVAGDGSSTEYTYHIMENGYISVSYGTSYTSIQSLKVERFSVLGNDEEELFTEYRNKVWHCFGTSISNTSSEGKYPVYLEALSGMIRTNFGLSGGCIGPSGSGSNYILNAIKNDSGIAQADVVTIEGFVNDWSQNVPIGELTDTDGSVSFMGALYEAITYIQSHSNAQIFVFTDNTGTLYNSTDIRRTVVRSSGKIQNDYIEATIKMCNYLGVPVIDAGRKSMISQDTASLYIADQIHHTELGGYQYAKTIWDEMKNFHLRALQVPQ